MEMISPATYWGIAAAIPAVLAEYSYRKIGPGVWINYLWLWLPIQLAIGYCIYRLVTIPNVTLIDAFVVWAFSTTAMRVVLSIFVLGDNVGRGTWVALILLVLARFAQGAFGR